VPLPVGACVLRSLCTKGQATFKGFALGRLTVFLSRPMGVYHRVCGGGLGSPDFVMALYLSSCEKKSTLDVSETVVPWTALLLQPRVRGGPWSTAHKSLKVQRVRAWAARDAGRDGRQVVVGCRAYGYGA
jgi:hypothetical protein